MCDIETFFLKRSGCFANGSPASTSELRERGIVPGVQYPAWLGRKDALPCMPQTAGGNLRDLSTLFSRLLGEVDPECRRYLHAHPFAGLDLGTFTKATKQVPTVTRYEWLMRGAVGAVDRLNARNIAHCRNKGQRQAARVYLPVMLRFMLALAFHTARRIQSICDLQVKDFLLSETAMRAALRTAATRTTKTQEKPQEGWCETWTHGAIYFRQAKDKENYDRPVPMNSPLRAEYEYYLRKRTDAGIDSPWLFTDPKDPAKPLSYHYALELLNSCEALAREMVEAEGLDPELLIPDLGDQKWHGFRALWENLRDDLGWFFNKNAAYAGGWTTKIGGPQDSSYRRLKGHYILAVMEGKSVLEVIEVARETERARAAIQTAIPLPDE